jgi:hypothetical protein
VRERVFSLETEYAIVHRPTRGRMAASASHCVDALRAVVGHTLGADSTRFLINGSKLHLDVGHAEWSLPECRSAREAAAYDRAADRTLAQAIPDAERLLADDGYPGRLSVIKNNVDSAGNTYGCHENYMASTETEWLDKMAHLRLSLRSLLPFLVTRQILCGTGRLGWGANGDQRHRFQISQRADFISELVSPETTSHRAIVNLGREKEPFAAGAMRRLHLILGDANLSGWATWLKLGTTGLVLRMLEDLALGEIPHLADPVAELHAVSRDPACRVPLVLRDATMCTAVEVQRRYCEAAAVYLREHDATEEEASLVAEWSAALDALDRDPMELAGKADWVTKRALIARQLERNGAGWDDLASQPPLRFAAQRIDIEYHDLAPEVGLYGRLLGKHADTLIRNDEIERARRDPPPHTRARIRGDLVRALRHGAWVEVGAWDTVEVNGETIYLSDPLRFFDGAVAVALDTHRSLDNMDDPIDRSFDDWVAVAVKMEAEQRRMVDHVHVALAEAGSKRVRSDAARCLATAPHHASVAALRAAVADDPEDEVRCAALEALAAIGSDEARRARPGHAALADRAAAGQPRRTRAPRGGGIA